MNTKKRDIVYQRWSRVILQESRDLAALAVNSAHALSDREVRGDSTLESMIRVDIQKRRDELETEISVQRSSAASAESVAAAPSTPSQPIPTASVEQVQDAVQQLTRKLDQALSLEDERGARAAFASMKAFHSQNTDAIPDHVLADYQKRVSKLRALRQQQRDQVAQLTERAVSASQRGKAEDLARVLRRLTAIHVAYPDLLDEAGLDEIRVAASHATEERRQHQGTTRALLERQKIIAAEIQKLGITVREFRRVACSASGDQDAFRKAEADYLRAIQKVRTYDTEWFSGVVLELADLLADWTVPPPNAEGQISRFLDSLTAGLAGIRADMRKIESAQDADDGAPPPP